LHSYKLLFNAFSFREPDASGGFPIFLMVSVVVVIIGYFVYHNKNKVFSPFFF